MLTLIRRCEPAVGVPPVRGKTLTAIGFLSGLICPSPALSVWAGSYGKAGSLPPGSSNHTSGPVGFTISVFPMAASAVFCGMGAIHSDELGRAEIPSSESTVPLSRSRSRFRRIGLLRGCAAKLSLIYLATTFEASASNSPLR